MLDSINSRSLSSFGVSVGTGLSLESIFTPTTERIDPDRKIPNKINPSDYKVHVYNVYTLGRNIISSIVTPDKIKASSSTALITVLQEEIDMITSMYDDLENVDVKFYMPDYKKDMQYFYAGKDENRTTAYIDFVAAMSNIYTNLKLDSSLVWKAKGGNEKTLILTNIAIDLVSLIKSIPNLALLESHTGKIKTKYSFNTKYKKIGKTEMTQMPFMRGLLYILGDNSLLKPESIKVRRSLLKVAIDKNWTPRTTRDKVREDIKSSPDLFQYLQII